MPRASIMPLTALRNKLKIVYNALKNPTALKVVGLKELPPSVRGLNLSARQYMELFRRGIITDEAIPLTIQKRLATDELNLLRQEILK